MENKNQRFSQR